MLTQGFRTRLMDGGAFAAETDAAGQFEQPISLAVRDGGNALLVNHSDWATAEVELEVGVADVEGVEVVLTRGGSIEGQVLLSGGADAQGSVVAASNGNGVVLTARADASGRYRLERLTPGPWQLRHDTKEEDYIMGFASEPFDGPYAGDCVVVEGQTVGYDLDLRSVLGTLTGSLHFDGRPAANWSARLMEHANFSTEPIGGAVLLDSGGGFAIEGHTRPGVLVLESTDDTRSFAELRREIEPGVELSELELELATGTLMGTAPTGTQLHLHVPLAGEWHYHATLTSDATGAFEAVVPAGNVDIRRRPRTPAGRVEWVTLRTVELVAGGRQSVELE